jgi:hypothetical protein
MTGKVAHRATRTWLLLVVLTAASMMAGHFGTAGFLANAFLLAAAVVKGRCMLLDFLKLRGVPPVWRALFQTWLVLVALAAWTASALPLLLG